MQILNKVQEMLHKNNPTSGIKTNIILVNSVIILMTQCSKYNNSLREDVELLRHGQGKPSRG